MLQSPPKQSQTLREYLAKHSQFRRTKSNNHFVTLKEEKPFVYSESQILQKLEKIKKVLINKASFSKEDSQILKYLGELSAALNTVFQKMKNLENNDKKCEATVPYELTRVVSQPRIPSVILENKTAIQSLTKKIPPPRLMRKDSQFSDLGGTVRMTQLSSDHSQILNIPKSKEKSLKSSFKDLAKNNEKNKNLVGKKMNSDYFNDSQTYCYPSQMNIEAPVVKIHKI